MMNPFEEFPLDEKMKFGFVGKIRSPALLGTV